MALSDFLKRLRLAAGGPQPQPQSQSQRPAAHAGADGESDVVDDMIVGSALDLTELRRVVREEPALADPHTQARLAALLDDIERERVKAPVLPKAAMAMLEAAEKPEVDVDDVTRRVAADPAIASRLIKLASSPLYGSPSIDGIHDALVRIGKSGMRTLAVDVSFEATLRPGPLLPIGERVAHHARAASAAARLIAPLLDVNRETAALTALAHGLGGLAILRRLESGPKEHPVPGFVVFVCLRLFHARVAGHTAKQYGFPDAIATALTEHHRLGSAVPPTSSLARVLGVADRIMHGEPGARAVPVAVAVERAGFAATPEAVSDALTPLLARIAA